MVVPSEKNTDIFEITMEDTGVKESALNSSNNSTTSDSVIKDPPTTDKVIERDKSEEKDLNNDQKSEDTNQPNHVHNDTHSNLAIFHDNDSPDEQSKSHSELSLSKSDYDEVTDLGEPETCIKVIDEEQVNVITSEEVPSDDSVCGHVLDINKDNFNDSIFDKEDDLEPTSGSTLFETIDTTNDCLDETADEYEAGFKSTNLTLDDKEEDLSTSPPREDRPKSPLLTSTPHSLPPISRSRVSSTPVGDSGPISLPSLTNTGSKSYDYLLKVLLVGDSDVGKQEILSGLEDGSVDSPYCSSTGAAYKTTTILIDGKRVKLQIWDTSGQGRFCTIIRSYSRGAQGILLVYDITNKWSFEGMDRWVREVEEHAPGIPKVLVGNRLHLAFKRQVDQTEAESYAERNHMGFYEVSPLVNFNITESFQELSRMALKRNGMERLWRSNKVLTLHELCCHSIVARTNVYNIDKLPLPDAIKANLKSYAMTNSTGLRQALNYKTLKDRKKKSRAPGLDSSGSKKMNLSRKSCVIS